MPYTDLRVCAIVKFVFRDLMYSEIYSSHIIFVAVIFLTLSAMSISEPSKTSVYWTQFQHSFSNA